MRETRRKHTYLTKHQLPETKIMFLAVQNFLSLQVRTEKTWPPTQKTITCQVFMILCTFSLRQFQTKRSRSFAGIVTEYLRLKSVMWCAGFLLHKAKQNKHSKGSCELLRLIKPLQDMAPKHPHPNERSLSSLMFSLALLSSPKLSWPPIQALFKAFIKLSFNLSTTSF